MEEALFNYVVKKSRDEVNANGFLSNHSVDFLYNCFDAANFFSDCFYVDKYI